MASWLAQEQAAGALIVESTFSSVPDLAARMYPIYPVGLLARIRYEAKSYVAQAGCPVLVIHSRSDEMIQTTDFYPTILRMLSLPLPKDYVIDGIDITTALRGGKLDREAMFTYFPHSPGVPDWLPPSMAVHSGDWKLIRLFHQGEDGAHDYRLYNLAEDIGERNSRSPRSLTIQSPSIIQCRNGRLVGSLFSSRP